MKFIENSLYLFTCVTIDDLMNVAESCNLNKSFKMKLIREKCISFFGVLNSLFMSILSNIYKVLFL